MYALLIIFKETPVFEKVSKKILIKKILFGKRINKNVFKSLKENFLKKKVNYLNKYTKIVRY